jgi:hypothetical protein
MNQAAPGYKLRRYSCQAKLQFASLAYYLLRRYIFNYLVQPSDLND